MSPVSEGQSPEMALSTSGPGSLRRSENHMTISCHIIPLGLCDNVLTHCASTFVVKNTVLIFVYFNNTSQYIVNIFTVISVIFYRTVNYNSLYIYPGILFISSLFHTFYLCSVLDTFVFLKLFLNYFLS